ncbi:hypothetical protein KRP22_006059 [Phytophthora ramorum]|nr:hypothetical protein KRP22_2811 [Phytophthora ramorum]
MFIRRCLKRNRLTVRRITHKGRKKRSGMELAVANMFTQSILRTVEEDGILGYLDGHNKYSSVYNMDQTAVYIDTNGRTTVDFVGTETVDAVQGSAVNGIRVLVFLAASATDRKLPLWSYSQVYPADQSPKKYSTQLMALEPPSTPCRRKHVATLQKCLTGLKGCGSRHLTNAGY